MYSKATSRVEFVQIWKCCNAIDVKTPQIIQTVYLHKAKSSMTRSGASDWGIRARQFSLAVPRTARRANSRDSCYTGYVQRWPDGGALDSSSPFQGGQIWANQIKKGSLLGLPELLLLETTRRRRKCWALTWLVLVTVCKNAWIWLLMQISVG